MKRVLIVLCSALLIVMLTSCAADLPRPEIREGEFAFSVTYEYAGEIKNVSGVYVCEYDGVGWVLDGGYYREWSGYIKDGTTEEFILLGIGEDGGEVELNLFFDPDRFMGDYYMEEDEPFIPIMTVKLKNEGIYFEDDVDLIYEVYGARVISYEYDEPIVNSFNLPKF